VLKPPNGIMEQELWTIPNRRKGTRSRLKQSNGRLGDKKESLPKIKKQKQHWSNKEWVLALKDGSKS